jgi:ATP-dependent DNA helicase UvrD/PcrA
MEAIMPRASADRKVRLVGRLLIKRDWEHAKGTDAPQFVLSMRTLVEGEDTDFYLSRANYYDAVDFDDSVFRTFLRLREVPATCAVYDQILIDEFQDFNKLEAAFIDLLADQSPILIAGDDDQALYSQLRNASHEFIRGLYRRGDYACFDLPFCMRSPEVVVGAFDDVVQKARSLGKLTERIDKPYLYFAPRKAGDSKRYPKIGVVQTSVQNKKANYIGRVIERIIRQIPKEEIEESHHEGFPTALVIGPSHYLRQVAEFLNAEGHVFEWRDEGGQQKIERASGLAILAEENRANLGWRTVLEVDKPACLSEVIRSSVSTGRPLYEVLPGEYRDAVLAEVAAVKKEARVPVAGVAMARDQTKPSIKLTSFEGSKGLSAQHVFILGLQEGELPRKAEAITDIEICRLLVALTRTRKQCHLIFTRRFGARPTRGSVFLSWIKPERIRFVKVDSSTWRKK